MCQHIHIEWPFNQVIGRIQQSTAGHNASIVNQQGYLKGMKTIHKLFTVEQRIQPLYQLSSTKQDNSWRQLNAICRFAL